MNVDRLLNYVNIIPSSWFSYLETWNGKQIS
jgi:hypothetical protein